MPTKMGLIDLETYLDLRTRYLRLLKGLRLTRDHNPETLEALERVLPPDAIESRLPQAPPMRGSESPKDQAQDAA